MSPPPSRRLVPAASTIWRSPTLVPVGPVRIRPPSASKNDHESLACSARPASRPRPRARGIVSRSTRAPAASVGPSTPSVPTLAATGRATTDPPCHAPARARTPGCGRRRPCLAPSPSSRRRRGDTLARVARQLVRQPLGVRAGGVAGFAGDGHVADDDLIAEAPRHRGSGVHGVERAEPITSVVVRRRSAAPGFGVSGTRPAAPCSRRAIDGHGIGSPGRRTGRARAARLQTWWHRPRSARSAITLGSSADDIGQQPGQHPGTRRGGEPAALDLRQVLPHGVERRDVGARARADAQSSSCLSSSVNARRGHGQHRGRAARQQHDRAHRRRRGSAPEPSPPGPRGRCARPGPDATRPRPLERRRGRRLVGETDDEPTCDLGTEHVDAAGGHGACRLAGRKQRHATIPPAIPRARGSGAARERATASTASSAAATIASRSASSCERGSGVSETSWDRTRPTGRSGCRTASAAG